MSERKGGKVERKRYPDGDGIESIPAKRSGVYQVINTVIGWGYIGSAKDVRLRCQNHRSLIHIGYHGNRLVQRDARIFGPAVFRFKVLELVDDLRLLGAREAHWIQSLQAEGPGARYNLEVGLRRLPESRYLITERVLLENRNFCLLPGVKKDDPVSEEFLKSWSPNYLLNRRG